VQRFGVRVLAVLLAAYAMAGFLLAAAMLSGRDPRLQWALLAAVGAAFGVSAGLAAQAAWRLDRRAPAALVVCGTAGAALCLAIPASAPAPLVTGEMWQTAVAGAVLFAAFLFAAAWYLRRQLARPG
jgi:hypothetical protein